MNPNELQGHLFLQVYGTQITEHCLLAQDKRVHQLISSLSLSAPTVGILEFNPHITGILEPRLLNPSHHGNTQTDTFLRIKMLMTVLQGSALMIQNVCKLRQLLSHRGNNNSCRLFIMCVSHPPVRLLYHVVFTGCKASWMVTTD